MADEFRVKETEENILLFDIKGSYFSPLVYIPRAERESFITSSVIPNIISLSRNPNVLSFIGLPDIHGGVDNPIGSVIATKVPLYGIGPDINCGVRSFSLDLTYDEIKNCLKSISSAIKREIPSGLGKSGISLNANQLNIILEKGLDGLKSLGMCDDEVECVENYGVFESNSRLITQAEKGKGLNQLGSVGSGNHYVEIQKVVEIFEEQTASDFGISRKNQIVISIHTGSRGFGSIVSKGLDQNSHTDIMLKLGCASNYAFANRSIINSLVLNVFKDFFPRVNHKLIYDVGHNNIKKEFHAEFGDIFITRKGASRAYSLDLPNRFRNGQPVPVGGSMGTYSYILKGLEKSLEKTFGSVCHGAGRAIIRSACKGKWNEEDVLKQMEGIILECDSNKEIIEEAPMAYKDINLVVDHCVNVGICDKIVKLEPIAVIKG